MIKGITLIKDDRRVHLDFSGTLEDLLKELWKYPIYGAYRLKDFLEMFQEYNTHWDFADLTRIESALSLALNQFDYSETSEDTYKIEAYRKAEGIINFVRKIQNCLNIEYADEGEIEEAIKKVANTYNNVFLNKVSEVQLYVN